MRLTSNSDIDYYCTCFDREAKFACTIPLCGQASGRTIEDTWYNNGISPDKKIAIVCFSVTDFPIL